MNIAFSAYTKKAFKEFILPNVNNTNYDIVLEKEIFETGTDVVLHFDVIDETWRILSGDDYTVESANGTTYGMEVSEGTEVKIICEDGAIIFLTFWMASSGHITSQKCKINPSCNVISIGSAKDNDIVCSGLNYISRNHAKLSFIKDGWYVENLSQNGIFLNSIRVNHRTKINYGDVLNIVGVKLVLLGDVIAISSDAQIHIKESTLIYVKNETKKENQSHKKRNIRYFNRAPRMINDLCTDTIEIESPPSPKQASNRSLFMTIGPAFTMTIPMLLGCLLMIYSVRKSGAVASPFMFMGLVTAVSSAILGVFWGLMNMRNDKKKVIADEKQRYDAYSDYLMSMASKIKQIYEYNEQVMHSLYPSATECAQFSENNANLWNRNITHEDFLTHRVGLGNTHLQADIQIPKEKFTLIKDTLLEKPKLIKDTYSTLKNVPICVDFKKKKLIGIVGGKGKKGAYELVRSLSVQIAASNCYTDVKLGYIFCENNFTGFVPFARWLPHCWSEDKKTRYCASGKEDASDVFYELAKIFRLREESKQDIRAKNNQEKPYYVLFIENVASLDGEPVAKYILDPENDIGVSTVILAENYEELPNTCDCIIYNNGEYSGVYSPQVLSHVGRDITFDTVSNQEAESFARRIADVQVSEIATGGEIPTTLTFLDMYGVSRIEELGVLDRWKKNRTYENMKALIGQKAGGTECYLDIHEKYHGPHGLVAGTTGSGKSETLQTYILSLAINFSPDDIGFLIIDFKGGGMANLFSDLPHMLGQISNLSGNQIRRAMISIKSENLRRQRVFSEHGVNNINAYTRLLKNNEATIPMPHLFIIIDEFAELKREEPEFMSELISVAQVGRSLGVHLILATQKPGGVVDDNIRSNSKFKLCLRVQDKQDSTEMLGRADAAYLSQAGRCFLQVGNDEIFELFQSGWSGATYDDSIIGINQNLAFLLSDSGRTTMVGNKHMMKQKDMIRSEWIKAFCSCALAVEENYNLKISYALNNEVAMRMFVNTLFEVIAQMGIDYQDTKHNRNAIENLINLIGVYGENIEEIIKKADSNKILLPEKKEKSQLDAVVEYLGATADKNGYVKNIKLWMPPLPEKIHLEEIDGFLHSSFSAGWKKHETWSLSVPIGICDDPVNQAQPTMYIDFAENGHLAVCGNVTSGKSTFMQTLMWSLISTYSPKELNLYAIDFSNHLLQAFEGDKHVGSIMYENDFKKIDKFFYMLTQMLSERKKAVSGSNWGQYVKSSSNALPSVVVVIDNYASFKDKTDNKYEGIIWEIARDGAGFGIFLAISAGGFGTAEIPAKIAENIRNVVSLDLGDKIKYIDVLRTSHIDVLPESNVKGRGLVNIDGSILEFQTALCLKAADDYERSEIIRQRCSEMNKKYKGAAANPVPEIPENPNFAHLSSNAQFAAKLKKDRCMPFAYDHETAAIYGVDLFEAFCYIISGKGRSGRTETLKVMAASARRQGNEVDIIDFSSSQLKRFSAAIEADNYASDAEELFNFSKKLLDEFKRRNMIKREMIEEDCDENEIYNRMLQEKRIVIFVSNFAEFLKIVYTTTPEHGRMADFYENILEKGRLHNIFFVFDLNLDESAQMLGRKIYNIVTGYKTGVHLAGGLSGQKIFDIMGLPFAEQSKTYKPGIGMAFDSNGATKIVIPLSKGV